MAEVLAIFGTLLALEIIFPGIVIAWWLLFPATVENARLRVERTPWRCFWLGVVTMFILLPPIIMLVVLPLELTRLVGCSLFFIVLAFASLGAAGLAARIGGKLMPYTHNSISLDTEYVCGAVALELAAGFWLGGVATVILLPAIVILLALPLGLTWTLGWSLSFIVLILAALGAAGLAGKKGGQWVPHTHNSISPAVFLRGAVALELATGFPIIGWFIVYPLTFLTALGATVFALLRWMPGEAEAVAQKGTG